MKLRIKALAVAVVLTAPAVTHAALVAWGTAQNITSDADVSTTGILVGAINLGSATTTTVNGVAFTGTTLSAGSVSSGVFNLAGIGSAFDLTTASAPFSTLSPAYRQLLGPVVFGPAPAPITLTLSGLIVGAEYQFQFWTSDASFIDTLSLTTATAGNSMTLNPSVSPGLGSNSTGGLGQYALGTFIADAAAQQIVFTGDPFVATINAMQLRQLAPAPASVPEPGTALAGVMLAGLLGVRRRRS